MNCSLHKRPLAACLFVVGLNLLLARLPVQGSEPAGRPGLEQLRESRKELAGRPRRVIFNNDGCDCFYFPKNEPATPQGLLAKRTADLAGTHVDALAYCTISSGFSYFTHRTQAGTVLAHSADQFGLQPDRRNIAQELIDQGTDCLQVMVDFARKNGKEIFWSMRMNDTHDVEYRPDRPYVLYPPLKLNHPEWLVGDPIQRTPYGRWSSVDYARPEIRDLALRYIQEVCENYDVDGVELDFFRHLCFFKATARGGAASQDECDLLTDLIRRVRSMTEEVGLRRGRPILVAVRVPDSLEYCRDMGLDLNRWLRDGLLDLLITTCYFRLNPWAYSVDLGHKYGVRVYPCLSDSRVTGEERFRRASLESYRAQAAEAWAAGADGIHLFNFPDVGSSQSAVVREAGDPQALLTKDKLYFLTVRDGNPKSYLAGGLKYQNLPVLTPAQPRKITAAAPLKTEIQLAENLSAAERAGCQAKLSLHLQVPELQHPGQLAVKFNGQPLTGGTLVEGWLDLPLPQSCARCGANAIEVGLAGDQPSAAAKSPSQRCSDVVVRVSYSGCPPASPADG